MSKEVKDYTIQKTNPNLYTDVGVAVPGGAIEKFWNLNYENTKEDFNKITNYGKAPGKNNLHYYDPTACLNYFKLKSIQFGNYTSVKQRAIFIYALASGLELLAKILKIDPGMIGINRKIAISYGERGIEKTLATYHTGQVVININRFSLNRGSLSHEYAHAIDHLTMKYKYKNDDYTFTSRLAYMRNDESRNLGNMYDIFLKLAFMKDYQEKCDDVVNKRVWLAPHEVFARASEMYFRSNLGKYENLLLCKEKDNEDNMAINPSWDEMKQLDKSFYLFFRNNIIELNSIVPNETVQLIQKSDKPIIDNSTIKPTDPIKPAITYKKEFINYGAKTLIETASEELKGQYGIIELDDLIPSNNPFTFSKNPKYPTSCQTRDYGEDQADQTKIEKIIKNFRPERVINNSPSSITGVPIILKSGVVLSGNGRTMSLQKMKEVKPENLNLYKQELERTINIYGFDRSIIDIYKNPILVKIVDIKESECSHYSTLFNESVSQKMDPIREGIAGAKTIESKKLLDYFSKIIETASSRNDDSMKDLYNDPIISKELIKFLREAKIIHDVNFNLWLNDDNTLTDNGKLALDNICLALVLPDKNLISTVDSFRNKIVANLPAFLQMKFLPADWNLIPAVQNAIKIESERRSSGQNENDILNQDKMFEKFNYSDFDKKVFYLFYKSGPIQLKSFFQMYLITAKNPEDPMFGTVATPEEVIDKYFETRKINFKTGKKIKENLTGLGDSEFNKIEKILNSVFEFTAELRFIDGFYNIIDRSSKKRIARFEIKNNKLVYEKTENIFFEDEFVTNQFDKKQRLKILQSSVNSALSERNIYDNTEDLQDFLQNIVNSIFENKNALVFVKDKLITVTDKDKNIIGRIDFSNQNKIRKIQKSYDLFSFENKNDLDNDIYFDRFFALMQNFKPKKSIVNNQPGMFGLNNNLVGMNDEIEYINGQDIKKYTPNKHAFKGVLRTFIPDMIFPFSMLIWGKQGQGKSSLSLLLANELTNFGKVLYFCTEEKLIFGRITNRLNNLKIHNSEIKFFDSGVLTDLVKILNTNQFKTVIIDSISKLNNYDELNIIKNEFPEVNFIFIAHSDKMGKHYIGNRDFGFLSDYEITVDNLTAKILKNRDNAGGTEFDIKQVLNKRENKLKYRSINIQYY